MVALSLRPSPAWRGHETKRPIAQTDLRHRQLLPVRGLGQDAPTWGANTSEPQISDLDEQDIMSRKGKWRWNLFGVGFLRKSCRDLRISALSPGRGGALAPP